MSNEIHVALATDGSYAMQTAVALASIVGAQGQDACVVHILHDGLPIELRERIGSAAHGRGTVDWIDARSTGLERARLPDRLPTATLFRLRIGELLGELDRVIYLDADTLTLDSLREAWEEPLDNLTLAAVRDIGFPFLASVLPWRALGLPPGAPYFNSGVMVISLDAWRSADVGRRALALAEENEFRHGDQCALNAACAESWRQLPARWNLQRGHFWPDGPPWAYEGIDSMTDALRRPAVVHFCNPRWNRPWLAECDHPYRSDWFARLDETPWAGWRPKPRPAWKTAAIRLDRARRVLLDDPDRPPWGAST